MLPARLALHLRLAPPPLCSAFFTPNLLHWWSLHACTEPPRCPLCELAKAWWNVVNLAYDHLEGPSDPCPVCSRVRRVGRILTPVASSRHCLRVDGALPIASAGHGRVNVCVFFNISGHADGELPI